MPAPPRILLPGTAVFITTRIQEGLPLIPASYMKVILEGILALAQSNFAVTICHFLFMTNHLHIFAVVDDPDAIPAFMNQVKTESAHAINRLLGRRQRSVWVRRYDSPTVLTLEDAIQKIAYIYTNPQSAHLVERIEHYPGLNSWKMFLEKTDNFNAPWIQRPMVPKLARTQMTMDEQKVLSANLVKQSKQNKTFSISPNAWMKIFNLTKDCDIDDVNQKIVEAVRNQESNLETLRLKAKIKTIGAKTLKLQAIDKKYHPRKFGQRMYCICRELDLKIKFIRFIKKLIATGKAVRERWKVGDYSQHFPFGIFPPRMHRLGNFSREMMQAIVGS